MKEIKGVYAMYKTIDISERKGNGFNDLTGESFGRLTVIGLSPRRSGRKSYWVCQCNCGNKIVVRSDILKAGATQSCGCIKKEQDKINLTVNHSHKESRTRLYTTWLGMKQRCYDENTETYARYGSKGIKVCDDWINDYPAFAEWARNNGYSDDLTIERIDVYSNYSPSNCTWISHSEQANNRRSTIWVEWDGKRQNLKQWSKELGISYGALNSRYNRDNLRPPELFKPLNKKYMPRELSWNGQTKNLADWAREYDLQPRTVQERYKRGIRPPELFEPVKKMTPR